MEQIKVRVTFKSGTSFSAWFNEFTIHRDETDPQQIVGIQHLLSDPAEAMPYIKLSDIVLVQVTERRVVDAEVQEAV